MKKSKLKQIIREEIKQIIKEEVGLAKFKQMVREEIRAILREKAIKKKKGVTYTATFEFMPKGEHDITQQAKISATEDTLAAAKKKVDNMAKSRFKKGYKKVTA